ncbi:MAG TPA: enolase C-terminal domain-like protein [Amycolatopsis sp.]|nr:enolase C-terminal domain-like protein [Amycolatopsis sp.]
MSEAVASRVEPGGSDLRVERVRILPLTLPIAQPLRYTQGRVGAFQRIVVELSTADGLVGYGECRGDQLRYALLSGLAGSLTGLDPYRLETLRWRIAPQGLVELFSGTVAVQAFSAIEMACLDLIGKATGRPVSDLLGGRVRDEVEIAGYLYYSDQAGEDELLAQARDFVESHGFTTLKYKCGVLDPSEEMRTLRRLREEFPAHGLRIDPNGAWGVSTSLRMLAVARETGVEYVEDPAATLAKNARIRQQAPGVALASNQAVASLETLALDEAFGAIDIPLIDLNWYGGFRAGVLAGRMAELLGRDVGLHSSMETAISQSAQLQLAACLANLPYASDSHYPYLLDDVAEPLTITGGRMTVPSGPGLGVDVDPDRLEALHRSWQETGFLSWDDPSGAPVPLPRW